MKILPEPLRAMGNYAQFLIYKLVPRVSTPGKMDKLPVDYRTGRVFLPSAEWQQDPAATTTFENASALAVQCGAGHGVGFFFKKEDPFFFLDIDNCLVDNVWSPVAQDIINRLPGAAVEVSQSGKALHIFGSCYGDLPPRIIMNRPLDVELHLDKRFAALTGTHITGSVAVDCTNPIHTLLPVYFPPRTASSDTPQDWTTEAVPEYTGPEDDAELVKRACAVKTTASVFGGSSSFKALWEADEDALSKSYPDQGGRAYDASSADMALSQHLAFWTGKNCERILSIMKQSELVRDKWEREEYLTRTILNTVALQKSVYSVVPTEVPKEVAELKLKGSEKQVNFGMSVLAQKIVECQGNQEHIELLKKPKLAQYWIDHKDWQIGDIIEALTPIESAKSPFADMDGPEFAAGFQYLGAEQQADFFKGCIYVQEDHRVFVPSGAMLKVEQFNATYGGYSFQFDDGGKLTKKAFEAFTESQVVRYPKAETRCFRPDLEPGVLIKIEGCNAVNTYLPIETKRVKGDPAPFLLHLSKILPVERDQKILLSYMAACVQHKGVKFQWAPLLQGMPGNGKSLFTRCMIAAIGKKYSHMPRSSEIGERFNAWLFDKLFIGVEDIYVPERKQEMIEILKPMITGENLERRAMQTDQNMKDLCCNFIFNSNHKNAVRKTVDDRRFAVFFTPQQQMEDMARDGMTGRYFPDLYDWLKLKDGYAIVTDLLYTYEIPEEFGLRALQDRAPETSSTAEAVAASIGGIEQEILEAIDEGRPGFAGGWVSSMALDRLLKDKRKDSAIPLNKRKEMLRLLGYEYHPKLNKGRVNNSIKPDNGRPRLFIETGSPGIHLTTAKDIAAAYTAAQLPSGTTQAQEVFGNG